MANTGIFDNDLILPGVITEIIPDYAQDYDTSAFGSTESVTIIGTAFNGPVGMVVPIYSPEHAKYIFGDSFDSATRREASLVAEIYDAWNKGCRTIYAVRVSGKEIYKDYKFATETKLKLRVSGIFPSNDNKEVFMNFVTQQGANNEVGTLKIYKPSDRSNMKEKMQGLVLNQNQMLITDIKLSGYGITKNSRLVDVIDIVNNIESNNVLRLAIVNEDGADVTTSSKEAQSLSVGVMFPGIYTIGRDKAADAVVAKTSLDFVLSKDSKPHSNYQEAIWRELIVNSDVAADYPIYAKSNAELNALFTNVSVDAAGEWLKPVGVLDKVTVKDEIDYEEAELDEFDLYKRLGSGFAQTAQIVEVKDAHGDVKGHKVAIPDSNDPNRVLEIADGVYSMLQNHSTDYTVMANANAETKISGRLPRKDVFKRREAGTIELKDNTTPVIELTANIDKRDFSEALNYKIEVTSLDKGVDAQDVLAKLSTEHKYERILAVTEEKEVGLKLAEGTKVMITNAGKVDGTYKLKVVKNGALVESTEVDGRFIIEKGSDLIALYYNENKYQQETIAKDKAIIGINFEMANIYQATADNKLKPVCVLSQISLLDAEEDYTVCFVERVANDVTVKIFSTEAQ